MQKAAKRPATYDDLLKVPDHLVAEIVEGDLYTSPRPASRHARAAGAIYSRLSRLFDDGDGGPGGWWVVFEPEIHLGEDVLVPDVAAWRRTRVPEFPDVAAWTVTPDWVCEVTSPQTGRLDRMRKLPAYGRHDVPYAWIVDPVNRTVEVFHQEGGRWVLISVSGTDAVASLEPFDAVEFPLASLWLPEPPPA